MIPGCSTDWERTAPGTQRSEVQILSPRHATSGGVQRLADNGADRAVPPLPDCSGDTVKLSEDRLTAGHLCAKEKMWVRFPLFALKMQ